MLALDTMNKPKKWLEKLNNVCLHEKVAFLSLALVLIILSFDCWFKNLPISGYALIFITLTLIGCTTWCTCHGIKWLLHCNKPLKFYVNEKGQNEKFLRIFNFFTKTEDAILDKLFEEKEFSPLSYPTTLNEQVRLFLKDTERDFVKPWYSEISQNPSFLFDTHLLVEEILFKLIEKLKLTNYKNVLLNILMLYLSHLQEYKKSRRKIARVNNQINKSDKSGESVKSENCGEITEPKHKKIEISDVYRFVHPGSQSDDVANYYLKKMTKWILQEYAPQEFVVSLQCKILTGIFARKILKSGLTTIEDPVWIYIKLIHLLDPSKYNELLQNRVYVVKERIIEEKNDTKAYQLKKPLVITKRYMKSNIFQETTNFFQRADLNNDAKLKNGKNDVVQGKRPKSVEKESLNLSLQSNNNGVDGHGHITSVLGGIISSTAGPLLPDNISVCYEPLNKMWQSPVTEKPKTLTDPIAFPLGKSVVEGMKIDSKHPSKSKRLSRSKSTDSMAPGGDVNDALKVKDISIGEELCENVRFTSDEDVRGGENGDEDAKVKPNRYSANVKKLIKTRSFDSGTIAMDSMSMESNVDGEEAVNPATVNNGDLPKEQGEVSPVYEEPEDFATTIAKLRSLLQQRESSSTLSDKSAQSIDLQTNSTSQAEMSDCSNKTQSTDLDNSSFDSQVAPDIPTDGRPFLNVCIPKSELMTDSHGSNYVLYSIQYDGIYKLKDHNINEEPELVLQTTVVKRRFQEFVTLQDRLEECSNLKSAMKGVKGPSKWLNLSFTAKTDENAGNRRQILENFIQQLCSKLEICAAPELHEFLAYGCSGNKTFVKKDSESSIRRIDKLLTNKVTDVFNTIKTALPSFDFDSNNSIGVSDGSKGSQDQKLLPGFLNFGNKTEEYELNFEYAYKESTGESLTDDIRRYFNEKTDSVENAVDVLDSNDWLSEKRECRPISSEGKCIWHGYKDVFDEDMDQLDSWLPVYSVILDIICELLEESDSWVIKEPVIRLIKVLTGHWESKIQERLSKLDWDQIVGNIIRLVRTIIFQSSTSPEPESIELDEEKTRSVLKDVLLSTMPNCLAQFIKFDEICSAVSLFVDSLQNFQANRDLILRFYDILLVQLLSCRHLTCDLN